MNQIYRANICFKPIFNGFLVLVLLIGGKAVHAEMTAGDLKTAIKNAKQKDARNLQEAIAMQNPNITVVRVNAKDGNKPMTDYLNERVTGSKVTNLTQMGWLANKFSNLAIEYSAIYDAKFALDQARPSTNNLDEKLNKIYQNAESVYAELMKIRGEAINRFYTHFGIDSERPYSATIGAHLGDNVPLYKLLHDERIVLSISVPRGSK
jgi:hypothetical protein